jgi:hypothetical protein
MVVTTDENEALDQELVQARALVERGEVKAALKRAERVRRLALDAEDLPVLNRVLGLAGLVYEQTDGKWHEEAGRLAYCARQNIRFIERKQAFEEGSDWLDSFVLPAARQVAGSDATGRGSRRLGVRFPKYKGRVWLTWGVVTVLLVVPVGALTGLLFGDPANGKLDTALAWGSTQELIRQLLIGVWLWVVAWTAIYFEVVNSRYRARVVGRTSSKTPGFALAVTALVLATFFVVPVAIVLAFVAWWRISATGTRYARGSAVVTTTFASVAVAVAVVLASVGTGLSSWSSWFSTDHTSEPAPTALTQPPSRLKEVVVGGLSIRVPAEWRSYDYKTGSGWRGVSLSDPRHEPSGAVIFGFYSQDDPGTTTTQAGKELAAGLRSNTAYSTVRERPVVFPSGIRAYEVRYSLELNGRGFTGISYALVAPSSSGTRGYLILYRAVDSQAGHMAQFRASAQTIKKTRSVRTSTQRGSGQGLKRIVVGDLFRRERAANGVAVRHPGLRAAVPPRLGRRDGHRCRVHPVHRQPAIQHHLRRRPRLERRPHGPGPSLGPIDRQILSATVDRGSPSGDGDRLVSQRRSS